MPDRPARTLLESHIRERSMTLEEFVEYAERFGRDHGEPGTLSLRHLQRLITGQQAAPTLRPATARLLERMFGEGIVALLGPPPADNSELDGGAGELRRMLEAARRVDQSVIRLLHQQLDAIRRLDRQLGAVVVRGELKAKIEQVSRLISHSLTSTVREQLTALLSEMHTRAGWQALDTSTVTAAWSHYEESKSTAAQSGSVAYVSHAAGEQSVVLVEAGKPGEAVAVLDHARREAELTAPSVLRAWLAAAHGEALAAHGQRSASLTAFDRAAELLPIGDAADERPYVALDTVHLARWRGHALARVGDPEAVAVLSDALGRLDPSFVRAETSLRVDLATALVAGGEREEARRHAERAEALAAQLGSARHGRRARALLAGL